MTCSPTDTLPAYRSTRAMTLFLGLFLLLLTADLALKSWSFSHVEPEGRTLIPHVLKLTLTRNEGAVFGMWAGHRWIFVAFSAAAIGVVGYFFCSSSGRQWVLHGALAMILAGAMGNLYDRLFHDGAVRDMLWIFPDTSLPWGWRWPNGSDKIYPWIFNIADVCLLLGIAMIFLHALCMGPEKGPEPSGESKSL